MAVDKKKVRPERFSEDDESAFEVVRKRGLEKKSEDKESEEDTSKTKLVEGGE